MALPVGKFGERQGAVTIVSSFRPFVPKVDSRLPAKAKEAARAEALLNFELLSDLNPKSVAIGAIAALSLWVLLN